MIVQIVTVAVIFLVFSARVWALTPDTLDSVVSVLPLWPGHSRGGTGDPMADAPEGSALAFRPGGYLVTAAHVVDRAIDVKVRLADGRILPAEIVAVDGATDIAVLRVDANLPTLTPAPATSIGQPVCAIGNQFGLGLSVTCGVVSAINRTGTGFNAIEDFVQTDASVNPGESGGALVDDEGRLVGMISAIFAGVSDTDIGVNFAASTQLLDRVADDLIRHGKVARGRPGLRVAPLDDAARENVAGIRVIGIETDGAAAEAGIEAGDIITEIAGRQTLTEEDVVSAFQLHRPGDKIPIVLTREGEWIDAVLVLAP